jgi:hypothetical protein
VTDCDPQELAVRDGFRLPDQRAGLAPETKLIERQPVRDHPNAIVPQDAAAPQDFCPAM